MCTLCETAAPSDYNAVSTILTISSFWPIDLIMVDIIPDGVVEETESFFVMLEFVDVNDSGRFSLSPNRTEVFIIDHDGK